MAIFGEAEICEIDTETNFEGFFSEIGVLAPAREVFVHHVSDAKETNAGFWKMAKFDGGVIEEVPDEKVFELVVIFVEMAGGGEMLVEKI